MSLSHEESHGAEHDIRGSSATTIMVPSWQEGQRERSMPVSSSSRSWADSFGDFRQSGIESQQFAALRESVFFGSVGQKAEVTDTHEAIGQYVEEKTADEFVGIKGHSLFSIPIFSIPIAQGDLAVLDGEDAVVGQSHAVGVAAEVIEHGLWRAERLFGIDHPVLLA